MNDLILKVIRSVSVWSASEIILEFLGHEEVTVIPDLNSTELDHKLLVTMGDDEGIFSLLTILGDPEAFKSHVIAKTEASLRTRLVFSESLESSQMISTLVNSTLPDNNTLAEHVKSCEDEESLAIIFEGNFEEFQTFYHSSQRRSLDVETRGFLMGIHDSPFKSLWKGLPSS